MLRDEILPDLSQRLNTSVESELAKKLEERVKMMEAEMRIRLDAMAPARSSVVAVPVEEGVPNLETDWRRFLVTRRVQEMNVHADAASADELVTPVSVVIHSAGNSSPAMQGPSGAVGTASGAVGPEGIELQMGEWDTGATGATGDVSGNTIVSTTDSVPTFTVSME